MQDSPSFPDPPILLTHSSEERPHKGRRRNYSALYMQSLARVRMQGKGPLPLTLLRICHIHTPSIVLGTGSKEASYLTESRHPRKMQ